MKDYYRILSVAENASEEDIKRAYRRLAKRYHPDVNAGAVGAEERFKEISEAYNVLSDPILKRAYDLKRARFELYSGNPVFYQQKKEPAKDKRDPRRKEYSEADLARARTRYRNRIVAQMQKRRKLLIGMIITFVIYLGATALFEYWIDQRRKEQDAQERMARHIQEERQTEKPIRDLDSPYDPVFGEGKTMWLSPNEMVIYNPVSDAVICLVENDPPHRTIRNEFVHARTAFSMKDLPNGNYYFKVYTGSQWDKKKMTPGRQQLGGFARDEEFFRIVHAPFALVKPTPKNPETNTSDTIVVDPTIMKFEPISREEFFSAGDSTALKDSNGQ